MSRTNDNLGRGYTVLPRILVKEVPAPVYKRKEPSKGHSRPPGKLTWEQICAIRDWHENDGLTATQCLRKAEAMGWPMCGLTHTRRILDYVTRAHPY